MACIAQISGMPTNVRLMPGQSVTYSITVTIPSITPCNCGSDINTISASVSSGFVVTLSSLPSLPLSGYCGTPFPMDITITALPNVFIGAIGAITIEFDHGQTPLQYAYLGVTVVDIVSPRIINLGEICAGGTVNIPICNPGDVEDTFNLINCSCHDFLTGEEDTVQLELDACECGSFTQTFSPDDTSLEGSGSCTVTVATTSGYMERITLIYDVVLCDLEIDSTWILTDKNNLIPIDGSTYDPMCNTYTIGAIGEKKILTLPVILTSPLQEGDTVNIASWMFAQFPNWQSPFPGAPIAGWRHLVCSSNPDGTYNMEWYGQQISNKNGTVELVISGGGTILTFKHTFYLLADTIEEPTNIVMENKDWLLNSVANSGTNLENLDENSIYKNPKYMSWAIVLERVSGTFQRAIFNIKGKLVWYGDNTITPAAEIVITVVELSIPGTSQLTEYVSKVRPTHVYCEFYYVSSDTAGTPPDDVWMVLINPDQDNNTVPFEDNYFLNTADLTNSINDTMITVVTPVTYTGADDLFYFEVEIAATTFDKDSRIILVSHHVTDSAVRTNILENIDCINYNDIDLTFTNSGATINLADDKYVTDSLVVPVNSQIETEPTVITPVLDAEVAIKSGFLITSFLEAVTRVALSIYYMAGDTRVQIMNPVLLRRNGLWIDDSQRRGLPNIVNRSVEGRMNLVFPFTVPDNIFRKADRSNLLNFDGTFRTDLREVQDCQPGLMRMIDIDIPGSPNLNGIIYIPELNELWSCDSANNLIVRVDAITLTQLPNIALTAGDNPAGLIQVGSKVFVACGASNAIRVINIYTQAVTSVSGITGTSLQRFALTPTQRLYCTCYGSDEVIEINPTTEAQVGSAISVGSNPIDIIYNPILNELFVGCFTSNNVYRIDNTNTVVTNIAVGGAVFRLENTENSVILTYPGTIVEINLDTFTATPHSVSTGALGALKYFDGVIYLACNATDNLCLIDPYSFQEITQYPSDTAPRDLVVYEGNVYVSNATGESITPYITQCAIPGQDEPNYSVALRDLYMEWKLTIDINGNIENYIYNQILPRVRPKDIDVPIDIDIKEYTGNGTPIPIDRPCTTTGVVHIEADFNANKTFLGLAIEAMPDRNNRLTEISMPSPNIIPVESEYISNVTTTAQTIEFDFDFPAWIANGPEKSEGELYQDYQFNIHVLAK